LDKALLIIMAKWHGFGRCKTRLAKDIGKSNSAKVQSMMTKHTISVAKYLQKIEVIDISINKYNDYKSLEYTKNNFNKLWQKYNYKNQLNYKNVFKELPKIL